jgi:hypothetical protein
MYGGDDPDNRRDMPSWAWDAEARAGTHSGALPDSQQTFQLVQRLASLRPLLRNDDYRELWRPNGGADVFAFQRGNVVVVLNGGDWTSGRLSIPIKLADGTIVDEKLQDGPALTVTGGRLDVELALCARALPFRCRRPTLRL